MPLGSIHAARAGRHTHLRRATRTDTGEPRHGHHPYRHVRCREFIRRRLRKLQSYPSSETRRLDERRYHAGSPRAMAAMYPSQTPTFDNELANELSQIPDGRAKSDGVATGAQRPLQLSSQGKRTARKSPNHTLGLISLPATIPANGARTRSARAPSLSGILGKGAPVCHPLGQTIPRPTTA